MTKVKKKSFNSIFTESAATEEKADEEPNVDLKQRKDMSREY
jgi:hypothetical protein